MAYGYGYEHHMSGGSPLEAILWIVIAVIAIALLLRVLRNGGGTGFGHCNSALHVLEDRYAKGEIETAEFHERKKVLLGSERK